MTWIWIAIASGLACGAAAFLWSKRGRRMVTRTILKATGSVTHRVHP